ncbi:ABC transporter-like protein [Lophiostoma macrostomum CBS 122681]|uniref:ABC transporter-like protein n=1 Tax=Lophiostoma macrostomum CBS 122681 TaxID=1314788 RepID=A0A6A6SPA2_9PLEO|nr:ABC transporter-like protein [Lophiostoma macrostomum CBS 122681]
MNQSVTGCFANGSIPILLARDDTCNLGFFCPNSSATAPPQYCPPSQECQAARVSQLTCHQQGILEPVLCPPGYYCPSGGKSLLECNKGSFCPQGAFEPYACSFGAICPNKAERQILMVPLAVMIGIDVIFAIILGVGFGIAAWRRRHKKAYAPAENLDDPDADDVELISRNEKPGAHEQRADFDDDLTANPDMHTFMRYMARVTRTKDIGLTFDFDDLQFEPKPGKRILQGVSGSIQRGSMWAIMGGSGAGKSTFFNVLMGKTKNTGGDVRVNGHHKDISKYKKLIGYVPQDDIVLPELTVRENILHSARSRLPRTWRDKDIQAYVDALISCIGLSHVQHSLVGDASKPVVSGGQRKRVSIGMELAAAPMAIFLDEPTSGLDATSASSIMRLLKAITKLGVTTITIIHQPREDIFHGFDNLLLLGNGSCIYAGPTEEASSYFGSLGFTFPSRANPADTIMDIITGNGREYAKDGSWSEDGVSKLIDAWRTYDNVDNSTISLHPDDASKSRHRPTSIISTQDQENSLHKTMKKRGASWYAQAYYCSKRSITQQVRNKNSFLFEIGVGALAGGIIGLSMFSAKGLMFTGLYKPPFTVLSSAVDYSSVPQMALLGAMAIGLAASAPAVKVFGEEKLIFNREAAAGHSMSAYYVGKIVSVLPRIALSSLHFTVFMGVLSTPLMEFQQMFAANLLYFYVVYGLASCVGMLVKREDGPLLAVILSLIISVFGGVAPPLSKVMEWNMEWLWRSSPGVWFAEAYVSQNWLPLDYLYMLDQASRATGFRLGRYALDMWMLFMLGSVYRVLAFGLLVTVQRKRHS